MKGKKQNRYSSLTRMVRFAESFPEEPIVATLSQQLSWSHFKEILPLKQPFQCEFYAEMCRVERWSVRTLRKKIDSMFYERTAISKKPEELARQELAELPTREELKKKLHAAIQHARAQLEHRREGK